MVGGPTFRPSPGACFSKVPGTFRARKSVLCSPSVPIHDQSFFNNFENDAIKLSVNKKIDWFVC